MNFGEIEFMSSKAMGDDTVIWMDFNDDTSVMKFTSSDGVTLDYNCDYLVLQQS
jgi:hypothetical protein